MNQPCVIPISFYQGETFAPQPILYLDVNGNPINLTGYSATFSARQTVNSNDPPIILATTGNGLITINGLNGSIQINLGSAFTSILPILYNGVWDLWIYGPALYPVTRLVGGTISILEPVTRS